MVAALKGSRFVVVYKASGAPTSLQADALLQGLDSGNRFTRRINEDSFTADRAGHSFNDPNPLPEDCEVLAARLHGNFAGLQRGQVYGRMLMEGTRSTELGTGYLSVHDHVTLGRFESSLSGRGYLYWNQEADDIAGNAADTTALALANTQRIVQGIIIKYHASGDVATRTITATLRDMATAAGPTGWSINSDTWTSPTLTLTADEEGLMHVGEHGFLSTNDAGTLAYADNTSAPNPFPFEVNENDTVDLIVAAGAGEAADDYDVWVQYEEWLTA